MKLNEVQAYHSLSKKDQEHFINEYIDVRTRLRSFSQEGIGSKSATDADIEKVFILISKLAKDPKQRETNRFALRDLNINECLKAVGLGDAMSEYTTRKELNKYVINLAKTTHLKNDATSFYLLKLLKHIENDKSNYFQARHNADSVTSFINISNDELLKILYKVENSIKAIKNLVSID